MYIDDTKLSEFSNNCFIKMGLSKEDAGVITNTMKEADYRGIHSHGFIRLPIYMKRIEKGYINPSSTINILNETDTLAHIDGDFGAGQVVGEYSMNKAIEKARNNGIGLGIAKNSNHFGIAAHYATMATQENMIGIVMSNVEPLMPAIGGAEKVIGNNPIAIASPSDSKHPIVLDMALSTTPLGKILVANSKGESIPEGWGVNKDGEMTTDPSEVLDGGFLYPVGGPKGFGLAFIAEILTGVLAGSQVSKEIPSMYDMEDKQSISHFMLAIDITKLSSVEEFKSKISLLSDFVKGSEKAKGTDQTFVPGEIEFSVEEKNKKKGIPMTEDVLNELKDVSKKYGVELLV